MEIINDNWITGEQERKKKHFIVADSLIPAMYVFTQKTTENLFTFKYIHVVICKPSKHTLGYKFKNNTYPETFL